MKPIYEKQMLELYAEKPNFGKLDKTHQVKLKNISCADEITIDLQIKIILFLMLNIMEKLVL